MFIGSFLSSVLVLPSIPEWNIENAAFTLYLCCTSGLLVVAIYRKRLGFGVVVTITPTTVSDPGIRPPHLPGS